MTLVSDGETEPIHSAIIRREAWTLNAVRALRADAERRLREGPWTVTADRPKGIELDPHEYYSEATYWWPNPDDPSGAYIRRDGDPNPARFMSNKNALSSMCEAVFTLGTAAFLLDDTRYGQRAARVINVWFLNPKTRMNPNLENAQVIPRASGGGGSGILDGRVFIRAVQGMEFLEQTGVWDLKEQAAVRRWFREYLQWLTQSKAAQEEKRSGNNRASWWTAQTAAIASFVDNQATLKSAFSYYRDHILPRQIRSDGSAPREETRVRSMAYSAFNLEALTVVCRIAQVHGENLWQARGRNGVTLSTVLEYLRPYLSDPRRWGRDQMLDSQSDISFLAFAGIGLKKPEYVAMFHRLERPDGAWLALMDLITSRWQASGHQTRH